MSSAAFSITLKEVFQNKKVLFSLLRSFALVFIIPFLMSLLFYFVSLEQTYSNTIELNTQVLNAASLAPTKVFVQSDDGKIEEVKL